MTAICTYYKKPNQGRKANRSVFHSIRHSACRYFRKQQKDPWLIATNMDPDAMSAEQIIKLYGKRMQIEECFRDLKSDKFGFGFTMSRSKNIERLNILLLISTLATLCLWWIGIYARQQGWHRHFQANTVSNRHVLSIPFLALGVIRRQDYLIYLSSLSMVADDLALYIQDKNQV